MAQQSPHQQYVRLLMERVRKDAPHPSGADLDRIEGSITTGEELREYFEYLFENVGQSARPSSQMLNRIERLLQQVPPSQSG
jgi:hypothetical protein